VSDADLRRLAEAVAERRVELRLTKEAAARLVSMSPITWKRVEDGQPVRELSYAGIETALKWPAGKVRQVLAGDAPDETIKWSTGQRGNAHVLLLALEEVDEATRQDMIDAALAAYRAYKRGRP
jgi:hypothetical protein